MCHSCLANKHLSSSNSSRLRQENKHRWKYTSEKMPGFATPKDETKRPGRKQTLITIHEHSLHLLLYVHWPEASPGTYPLPDQLNRTKESNWDSKNVSSKWRDGPIAAMPKTQYCLTSGHSLSQSCFQVSNSVQTELNDCIKKMS